MENGTYSDPRCNRCEPPPLPADPRAPKPYHSGSLYNRTMDRIADAINSHIPPAQIEELDVLSRSRAE